MHVFKGLPPKGILNRLLVAGVFNTLVVSTALAQNPLNTSDQYQSELTANAITASPLVAIAATGVSAAWKLSAIINGGVLSYNESTQINQAAKEYVYGASLLATNYDKNNPKILSIGDAPHYRNGTYVSGSRVIYDNPDTVYRPIPINPYASYIIKGKRSANAPVDTNYSVWSGAFITLSNLNASQIQTDSDGNFVLTVDSSPANGRLNHIQLPPNAAFIWIRDTVHDWSVQKPDDIQIVRTSPAPAIYQNILQLVSNTIQTVNSFATNATTLFGAGFNGYNQLAYKSPVNTIPAFTSTVNSGRLSNQIATYSPFKIANDEALIVTLNTANAKYASLTAYTRGLTTIDATNHTQSLNNKQAIANEDGTYTFVVSPSDPKVYNWVDTVGVNHGLLNLRLQGNVPNAKPYATAKLVKLNDLYLNLPYGTAFINKGIRQNQLAQRAASYNARFDN